MTWTKWNDMESAFHSFCWTSVNLTVFSWLWWPSWRGLTLKGNQMQMNIKSVLSESFVQMYPVLHQTMTHAKTSQLMFLFSSERYWKKKHGTKTCTTCQQIYKFNPNPEAQAVKVFQIHYFSQRDAWGEQDTGWTRTPSACRRGHEGQTKFCEVSLNCAVRHQMLYFYDKRAEQWCCCPVSSDLTMLFDRVSQEVFSMSSRVSQSYGLSFEHVQKVCASKFLSKSQSGCGATNHKLQSFILTPTGLKTTPVVNN